MKIEAMVKILDGAVGLVTNLVDLIGGYWTKNIYKMNKKVDKITIISVCYDKLMIIKST